MREGRLVAELPRADATPERVIAAAAGMAEVGGMSAVTNPHARASPQPSSRAAIFRLREVGIAIALLVCIVDLLGASADNFLTVGNWQDIATDVAMVAVVAVGETMVVLTRNIDLSVGSIVGVSAYVAANTLQHHHGAPIVLDRDRSRRRVGAALRPRQRAAGRLREDPGDHRDARHARDLPRHRLRAHERRERARGEPAAGLPQLLVGVAARRTRRSPGSRSSSRSWARRSCAGPRGRATSTRSARTPRRRARRASRWRAG